MAVLELEGVLGAWLRTGRGIAQDIGIRFWRLPS